MIVYVFFPVPSFFFLAIFWVIRISILTFPVYLANAPGAAPTPTSNTTWMRDPNNHLLTGDSIIPKKEKKGKRLMFFYKIRERNTNFTNICPSELVLSCFLYFRVNRNASATEAFSGIFLFVLLFLSTADVEKWIDNVCIYTKREQQHRLFHFGCTVRVTCIQPD